MTNTWQFRSENWLTIFPKELSRKKIVVSYPLCIWTIWTEQKSAVVFCRFSIKYVELLYLFVYLSNKKNVKVLVTTWSRNNKPRNFTFNLFNKHGQQPIWIREKLRARGYFTEKLLDCGPNRWQRISQILWRAQLSQTQRRTRVESHESGSSPRAAGIQRNCAGIRSERRVFVYIPAGHKCLQPPPRQAHQLRGQSVYLGVHLQLAYNLPGHAGTKISTRVRLACRFVSNRSEPTRLHELAASGCTHQ